MSDRSFAGPPHEPPPGILSDDDEAAIEAMLRRRIQEIDDGVVQTIPLSEVWHQIFGVDRPVPEWLRSAR